MSRDIKFRGLTANNEFVYGDLSNDVPNSTCYYKEYSQRICWLPESGGQANCPVKNGTVGQFTGLDDKNGVEIFEGDILYHYATFGYVLFEDGMFSLSSLTKVNYGYRQPLCYIDTYECKVVGNIHQNTELLEATK